jgi:hypothetical protein
MMMSRAVTEPPTSTRPGRLYSILLVPTSLALPIKMSWPCRQRCAVQGQHRRGAPANAGSMRGFRVCLGFV